jgi:hypothetical protein
MSPSFSESKSKPNKKATAANIALKRRELASQSHWLSLINKVNQSKVIV